MKKLLLLMLFLPLVSIVTYGQTCDDTLMKHVYHPDRLVTQKGCITVTGRVIKKKFEKDGDIHIQLKFDPGQGADLINSKNRSAQRRALVFEPICAHKVTQADAKKACKNFYQNITIPNKGDKVSITGMHVLDTEHGWLEIHPVTSVVIQ